VRKRPRSAFRARIECKNRVRLGASCFCELDREVELVRPLCELLPDNRAFERRVLRNGSTICPTSRTSGLSPTTEFWCSQLVAVAQLFPRPLDAPALGALSVRSLLRAVSANRHAAPAP